MTLQYGRQVRMIRQPADLGGLQLSGAAVEHGMDIVSGQSGDVDQPVDVGMLRMDRLRERPARSVVPGANRVGRRADPDAATPRRSSSVSAVPGRERMRAQTRSVSSLSTTSRSRRRANLSRTTVSMKAVANAGAV